MKCARRARTVAGMERNEGHVSGSRPVILIGFEDTGTGRDALALGAELARLLAASVVVSTVLPYPRHLLGPADLERALAVDTAESFAFVADELADLDAGTVAVADHSPAAALERIAAAEGANLIVVGSASHGPRGLVRHGSVGTSLLHGAPCAVAVAPVGFALDQAPVHRVGAGSGRIGVGFDGSPEAWAALETGIAMARRADAELRLIGVAEPPSMGYSEALNVLTAEEVFASIRDEMLGILELGTARVADSVPVDARPEEGHPAARLIAATTELDLLVLGSRGYGPLRRTLLGSVSRVVLSGARCPVLVLPRAAGTDPLGVLHPSESSSRERIAG